MRRVAVTGLGIVSSIGSNKEEVAEALRAGRSGIVFAEDYAERGFRSHVKGQPRIDLDAHIDRRVRRFMGDGAAFNYVAMVEAIADAGLPEKDVSDERTGLIVGSGGPSTSNQVEAADIAREKGVKRVGPYMVPRCMSSTNSANLATAFKIKGHSYTISSACSTSAHCIGNGAELIQYGKHGFVIAGGGGVVVLEEMERAKARGAKIYGELVGYGATSDGADMVAPSGEGAVRCMRMALSQIGNARIDYINTHGTSTPVGDGTELRAIKEVFGDNVPTISSTKSMTGHAQGAAGVTEAIYSLLMMERGFIAPSINIEEPDEAAEGIPIARVAEEAKLDCVLSNSFGFGGTNCSLAFRRVED